MHSALLQPLIRTMSKRKLRLIDSIDQERHYEPADVARTLSDNEQTLALHAEFTGRPATRIYADQSCVVKLRSDLQLKVDQAAHWIKSTLEKERNLGVHHPHKTWFYIFNGGDDKPDGEQQALIGSITPRMRPLHIILSEPPEGEEARARYLDILTGVFRLCLRVAKENDVKLDEGLSNFTLAPDGELFYVDDEYYQWDKFISFSTMLGVYIRSFRWLDREFVEALSNRLIEQLDEIFNDVNCRATIAYQLRSAFMPSGKKQELANLMSDLLIQRPQFSPQHVPNRKPVFRKQESNTIRAVLDDEIDLDSIVKSDASDPEQTQLSEEELEQIPASERYLALIADIHANLPALENVLAWLDEKGITDGVVLGDLVGYGPDPSEVMALIRERNYEIIKGNHDHAVAQGDASRGFSRNAKVVAEWTHEHVSEEEREWLKYLPPVLENEEWMAVHGAPMDPEFFFGYVYAMTYSDNLEHMQKMKRRLCFHGHSHMPGIYARDMADADHHLKGDLISLQGYRHCLICPGSVGQPRNGDPSAQFALYDRIKDEVQFHAVPYPLDDVVERMKQFDFPSALWTRLPKGQ